MMITKDLRRRVCATCQTELKRLRLYLIVSSHEEDVRVTCSNDGRWMDTRVLAQLFARPWTSSAKKENKSNCAVRDLNTDLLEVMRPSQRGNFFAPRLPKRFQHPSSNSITTCKTTATLIKISGENGKRTRRQSKL